MSPNGEHSGENTCALWRLSVQGNHPLPLRAERG